MNLTDDRRLAPDVVEALHAELAEDLRRLALGVLRDSHLAADVVQATFAKAIEQGHSANESLRGWLFRVAMNEALAIKRRQGTQARVLNNLAWLGGGERGSGEQAEEDACRREDRERILQALKELPLEQRQVVLMRLYEQKTFAVISGELKVPLGTVLWRMQAALKRLRERLGGDDGGDNE